jgi:hypothetical protein
MALTPRLQMAPYCPSAEEKFAKIFRTSLPALSLSSLHVALLLDRHLHTSSADRHDFHTIPLPIQNEDYRP